MSPRSRQIFAKALLRASRRPALGSAVVGVRATKYFLYRTRFLLPRALLRTLLHGVELYLLSTVVPWNSMGPYFLLRGVTLLVSGIHFGWLEGLRTRVRELYAARRFGAARASAARWLRGSALWGLGAFTLAIAWLLLDADGYPGFSVFDAFALACGLRIALEALARTVHSMLYAVRRVRRSLSSLMFSDAVEPLSLILLFPSWGLWSFAMVAVLGGAVRSYLTYAWTRNSLVGTRLDGPLRVRKQSPPEPEGFFRALLPALTGVTAQIDAILLVAFASSSEPGVLAVIYLARPLLSGVQGALRTFYFDFKKLEGRCPAVLQRSFSLRLRRLALTLGVLAGLAMALVAAFLSKAFDPWLVLGLVAFGGVRSLFSLGQVGAFASARYGMLLAVTALACGIVWGATTLGLGLAGQMVIVTACLGISALWLLAQLRPASRLRGSFPLYDLLRLAATESRPLVLFSAELHPQARVPLKPVLGELRSALPTWFFFRDGRARVFGLTPQENADPAAICTKLLVASGGTLRNVRAAAFESGSQLISRLRAGEGLEQIPLSKEHRALLQQARRVSADTAASWVNEMKSNIAQLQALRLTASVDWSETRAPMKLLALSGVANHGKRGGAFAAIFPGDTPDAYLLFCPYDDENRRQLASWHERLHVAAVSLGLNQRGA